MKTSDIMIINRLETGTAFATTIVGNEAVFVPAKITTLLSIQVGERYTAILIENKIHPEKTPWMAIRVDKLGKQPPVDHDDLTGVILNDLRENGTATVEEMANAIDYPLVSVIAKMQEMARGGLIMRRTIYAIDEADFAEADE